HGQVPTQGEMTKATQIITNRVNATGLTGSLVNRQGANEIVVSVPGAGAQKVATLVGETAQLRLRQVLLQGPNGVAAGATPPPTPTPAPTPTPSSTKPAASSNSTSPSTSPSASGSATASPSSGTGQVVGASKLGAAATPSPSSAATSSPKASSSPSATPTP